MWNDQNVLKVSVAQEQEWLANPSKTGISYFNYRISQLADRWQQTYSQCKVDRQNGKGNVSPACDTYQKDYNTYVSYQMRLYDSIGDKTINDFSDNVGNIDIIRVPKKGDPPPQPNPANDTFNQPVMDLQKPIVTLQKPKKKTPSLLLLGVGAVAVGGAGYLVYKRIKTS